MVLTKRERARTVPDEYADYIIVGWDPAQSKDGSIVTVSRPFERWTGRATHQGHEEGWGPCGESCYPVVEWVHEIQAVKALPPRESYPGQASRLLGSYVEPSLARRGVKRAYVLIDATGVGAAAVDAVREEIARRSLGQVSVTPVVIGAGPPDKIEGGWIGSSRIFVSGACLMTRLRAKAELRRLSLPAGHDSEALLQEIRSLEFEQTPQGTLRFGAASGAADDRVYSLAIATLPDLGERAVSFDSEWI